MTEVDGTKIIPDLSVRLIDYVRAKLLQRIKKNPEPDWKYKNGDVYEFGDAENGYIVLVSEDQVDYFVRIKRVSHNRLRLGRQVLLWRNRNSDAAAGFAQRVFFTRLLPRYGALIADKEQTKSGSQFWQNAVESALGRGLYVYFLDRRSRNTKLVPIRDLGDLQEHHEALWGTARQHLLTFAVISQQELELK